MAINRRPSLFNWQCVESRSDLDRLRLGATIKRCGNSIGGEYPSGLM